MDMHSGATGSTHKAMYMVHACRNVPWSTSSASGRAECARGQSEGIRYQPTRRHISMCVACACVCMCMFVLMRACIHVCEHVCTVSYPSFGPMSPTVTPAKQHLLQETIKLRTPADLATAHGF